MGLLILFASLSVGISFLCSLLEATLLSITPSYVKILEEKGSKAGKVLKRLKDNIDTSIASILILNTIANTLGATAVGAQAAKVFGEEAVVVVSIILTFAILIISEIIPKTIGSLYWKKIALVAAYIIDFFIKITYPLILFTRFITTKIAGKKKKNQISKEDILATMMLGEDEGIIDENEVDVIENLLKLDEVKVADILTPRSVVFALEENMRIESL